VGVVAAAAVVVVVVVVVEILVVVVGVELVVELMTEINLVLVYLRL
jgi:hypothetical protein